MEKKLNPYFIFSYPTAVFIWILIASIGNAATPTKTAKGGGGYRCVVIDPSIGKEKADDNVHVFTQEKNEKKAQYVGKTAVLDFNFAESPISVSAKESKSKKDLKFTETKETIAKFDGYIKDVEIEVHCKKR